VNMGHLGEMERPDRVPTTDGLMAVRGARPHVHVLFTSIDIAFHSTLHPALINGQTLGEAHRHSKR
jgi:hypothetical protein